MAVAFGVSVCVAVATGVRVCVAVLVGDGVLVLVGVDVLVGVRVAVAVAVLVGVGVSKPAAIAESIRTRGTVTKLRESVIGTPVLRMTCSPDVTDMPGSACRSSAQAPATCGVAIDVPFQLAKLPPGIDELIAEPGARIDRNDAEFE